MRNANDGISMRQTAEGALSEITDNLQRMRELAVQAANGTNQDTDRDALDAELQQLVSEIERVADATEFNGNTLFDGSFTANIQVGADNAVTDTFNRITVGASSFIDAQTATLGATGSTTISETLDIAMTITGLASNDLLVNGVDVGAVGKGANGCYAANLAAAIQSADLRFVLLSTVGASTLTMAELGAWTTMDTTTDATIKINDILIYDSFDASASSITAAELDKAIDSKQSELSAAGITYTGSVAGGDIVFTRADGGNINYVTLDGATDAAGKGFANADSDGASVSGYGTVTLTSDFEFVLDTSGGTIANAGTTAQTVSAGAAAGTALASIDCCKLDWCAQRCIDIDRCRFEHCQPGTFKHRC